MQVVVYKSFDEIPGSVKNRISYPAQTNFFLTLGWFRTLHETVLQQTKHLRIYIAYDPQESPLGVLFSCTEQNSRTLTCLTNYYSLEFAPVIFATDSSVREKVMNAIIDFILCEKPTWDVLEFKLLKSIPNDDDYLLSSLGNSPYLVATYFQYDNWYYLRNNDDFIGYYNARPSRLRNTIKRKSNALNKAYAVDIRIYKNNDHQLAKGINDFTQVYNHSWKNTEPYRKFIPALIETCASLGILRMGILYLDNRPAAAQVWITTVDKAIIYKLAYDERYKKLSVGSILSKRLFEIAIDEDKVKIIDYGVGSESYKQEWMQSVRKIYGIEAIKLWSIKGLLAKCRQILNAIGKEPKMRVL